MARKDLGILSGCLFGGKTASLIKYLYRDTKGFASGLMLDLGQRIRGLRVLCSSDKVFKVSESSLLYIIRSRAEDRRRASVQVLATWRRIIALGEVEQDFGFEWAELRYTESRGRSSDSSKTPPYA